MKLIYDIEKRAIEFFLRYANLDENSKGFGLVVDDTSDLNVASIAASGFFLSALIIAVERKIITYEVASNYTLKMLKTFNDNVCHYQGFFAHFVNIHDGKRHNNSEFSTIDTVLLLCGMLASEQYFNNEQISNYVSLIIKRINFEGFVHLKDGKETFYMSYNIEDNKNKHNNNGYIYHWGMFAEQLPMYVIYAGLDYKNASKLYYNFERLKGEYHGIEYIYSPGNALFIYQFPLCYLDLENIVDKEGINWFENAKKAIKAHQKLSIELNSVFKTLNKYAFGGFTALKTKHGYRVFGGLPNVDDAINTDGTVAPHAVVGSLSICNECALEGIKYLHNIPGLYKKYGFVSGYNLDLNWVSDYYLAIDKGLELLMSNAYLSNDVRKVFMKNPLIVKGMRILNWNKQNKGD